MKALIIVHLGLLMHLTAARFVSDNICLAMPNGQKLPVTDDCSSYIVCDNNAQSIKHCPNGLLFDPQVQVCNWASMVKCGQTPTVPEPWRPVTTSTVHIPTAPTPSPTTPRPVQTTTAPTTTTTRATTTTTTTAPPPTTTTVAPTRTTTTTPRVPENNPYPQCTSDGFYFIPHPSACESYYICAYGMLILHSCGQGVYWNSDTNQCDFPERTNCSNLPNPAKPETSTPSIGTTTPSKLPNCRSSEIFHPSIEDCSKYYICIGSSPILMSCPSDYLWNADISQCDRPEQARCATSFA
ncbi:probable chitinase 10 [Aedes aegypti]|uniref:Chitin-binding type-2 domain-containing protein n=1 Tax=Aedes aegypti TaxID=7159 RepID=A0A1S4F2J1_AEDAE|nr:probable chitinase 10 [Aedes aegypti]